MKNPEQDKLQLVERKDRRLVLPGVDITGEMMASKPLDISPLQWMFLLQVENNKELIEANGLAQLESMALLLRHKAQAPPWLVAAFCKSLAKFQMHEAATLDEAFNIVPMTLRTRKSLRERRELIPKVSRVLVDLMHANPLRGISGELFEEAGEKLGISKKYCEELYREGLPDRPNLLTLKKSYKILKKSFPDFEFGRIT